VRLRLVGEEQDDPEQGEGADEVWVAAACLEAPLGADPKLLAGFALQAPV